MDPITAAIVAALTAGAVSGLTETSKTAITDTYTKLKELLTTKFGKNSEVVKATDHLEIKPESIGRRKALQEKIIGSGAEQDEELLTVAKHMLTLVQTQQAGWGKFTIQNNASVQGQNIAETQQIEQHFGAPPKE